MHTTQVSRRDALRAAAVAGTVTVLPRAGAAETPDKSNRPYKISLAAYSYRKYLPSGNKKGRETIFDFVDLCAKWGCAGTEPTTYYLTGRDRAYLHKLKRQAFLLGLDVTSTAVGNNFCLPPGEELTRQLDDVKAWIDGAVLMGAPVIRIFGGRGRKGLNREKAFQYATDTMKRACDYAGEKGVFLAIENHGYLTERAEDVLRIVDTVNHPWLGINLDTGNFVEKPYENIALAAPKALTCQVKIELRTADGKGREPADFERIVKSLRKANYRGYLVLEYEGKGEPKTDIPLWLDRLREAASA